MLLLPALRKDLNLEVLFLLTLVCYGDMVVTLKIPTYRFLFYFFVITVITVLVRGYL